MLVASVLTFPAALLLRRIRTFGVARLPACRRVLARVGVFPITDHCYEPQFRFPGESESVSVERSLPGIDWNVEAQLVLLDSLRFAGELAHWPKEPAEPLRFHLENRFFESGDAEFWYQLIRLRKPRRIFEIGSGYSTLVAVEAIRRNREEDPGYTCRHVCIEPYEAPWLEGLRIDMVRERVETLDVGFFAELEEDDILFIDSSHVIRPWGDVVFEYLQLLPTLRPGVIVHVHDIFSPRNYPASWMIDDVRLWNEQYLVEAFLTHNDRWRVVAALNLLHHRYFERLRRVAPSLTPAREPASLYMQKV